MALKSGVKFKVGTFSTIQKIVQRHQRCPRFLSPLAVEVRAHIPVIESLKQEGAHAGPGTPSNGVTEDKPLQTVTVVRLSIQDVKYLLIQTLSLGRVGKLFSMHAAHVRTSSVL